MRPHVSALTPPTVTQCRGLSLHCPADHRTITPLHALPTAMVRSVQIMQVPPSFTGGPGHDRNSRPKEMHPLPWRRPAAHAWGSGAVSIADSELGFAR